MPVDVICPIWREHHDGARQLRGRERIDGGRGGSGERHQGDDDAVRFHQTHHVRYRGRSQPPGPAQIPGSPDGIIGCRLGGNFASGEARQVDRRQLHALLQGVQKLPDLLGERDGLVPLMRWRPPQAGGSARRSLPGGRKAVPRQETLAALPGLPPGARRDLVAADGCQIPTGLPPPPTHPTSPRPPSWSGPRAGGPASAGRDRRRLRHCRERRSILAGRRGVDARQLHLARSIHRPLTHYGSSLPVSSCGRSGSLIGGSVRGGRGLRPRSSSSGASSKRLARVWPSPST